MLKRYMLRDTRLVFLKPAERAELDEAERLWKESEPHTCHYVLIPALE